MKLLNFLFLEFFILSGCDELSFTNSEIQAEGLVDMKKTEPQLEKPLDDSDKEIPHPLPETKSKIETPDEISEEETTLISENMELTKDTVIKNRFPRLKPWYSA